MYLKEARRLFFSQYYMQEVYVEPIMGNNPMYFNGANIDDNDNTNYLLLRSVNQLKDEEYLNIGKLTGIWSKKELANLSTEVNEVLIKYGKMFCEAIGREFGMGLSAPFANGIDCIHEAFQYILRIGGLLPFTYINEKNEPITLQCYEIIELEWAKYKF